MAVENKNALPNGTILKHNGTEYRIERFLGSGGFGITYLVCGERKKSSQTISQLYAVKEHFMSQDCERDSDTHSVVCSKPAKERVDEGKKDFISEANRLKNDILHSHIVSVKAVFEANNTAYYVMEFLDGKSLRSYIRKYGACREEEAILLLLPIARAIGYLHDKRITHLDIKPDNIMIVENEEGKTCPILIDFGLSKHYDKKGNPTSSIRVQATSDGYSPMEQYLGISDFQPTADIYALAATMVYCLTGKDPKRAADIRPGEMRTLLEGKISEASLAALLNALNPSKYERTASIRDLLSELCPEEDLSSWDTETDNNITDPIFFRRKKMTLFSRLKNFFGKKSIESLRENKGGVDTGYDLLPIPDVSMVVEIRQPKELGLSKEVWLCNPVCNTVFTYYGADKIDDEDFLGGIPKDVLAVLKESGLLSPNPWENDFVPPTSAPLMCKFVKITFNYKDGTKFIRENSGVYGSSRLLEAAESILNCHSISHFVYGKDKELAEKVKGISPKEFNFVVRTTPIPDKNEGKLVSSYMIGVYKGFVTEISLQDWGLLNNDEKAAFSPRFVYFKLDGYGSVQGQTIGMSIEEPITSDASEVKNVLVSYAKTLNPSGISGSEQGECHLPNPEETRLLEYYHERINLTLEEWGLKTMSDYFWTDCNSQIIPNSSDPQFIQNLKIGIRLIVDYWATRINYTPENRQTPDVALNGVRVLNILKTPFNPIEATLYQIPQIFESILIPEILDSNFDGIVAQLLKAKLLHFPSDDETPIDAFWNRLNSSNTFFLVENELQFIHAQLLQHEKGGYRIYNPSVLNALWEIVSSHKNTLMSPTSDDFELKIQCGNNVCKCDVGDGMIEVKDIIFTDNNESSVESGGVIKGGIIQHQIMQAKLFDILLLDIIEYEISLAIMFNGAMRDFLQIIKKENIPTKKTEELPRDLIKESELFLYVGNQKININLTPYFEQEENENIVQFSIEIDANKCVSLSFGNNNEITLGQILSENNSGSFY